jgi:nucleotide-binding universal stress UspA family protein
MSDSRTGGDWLNHAMSSPILAAYCPKDADRGPIEFAVAAARFTGAPLVVVSVRSGGSLLDRLTGGEFTDDSDAPVTLDTLRSELAALDIDASVHVIEHHTPAGGVAAALEELHPRLLVLGSSRRGPVGRVLAGSTAERLIHGAPCPVVVVPHGHKTTAGGAQLVGAAFVPTPEGKAALEAAALLARALEARLLAVMVLDPKYAEQPSQVAMARVRGEFDLSDDDAQDTRERLVATDALRAALAELGDDVESEPDVLFQDPLEGLTAASERTDLLVIGSRGYGPAKSVMLGGISRRLIAAAHCPVLVLPRADAEAVAALVGGATAQAAD